jgi:adenylate cyclase
MTTTQLQSNLIAYTEALRCERMTAMYVDLDDFMRICTDDPPEAVFGLIGNFQRVVTDAISSFRGELNAYQGDGVLATFGDVAGRAECATRTLRCVSEILERVEALSHDHTRISGRSPSVSIGLQYGQIWTGNISISRSFGPTLIGDAVNVATRLEQGARKLGAKVVVGDDLIQRAWRESASNASELAHYVNVGPLFVHGRQTPVNVWKLPTQSVELLP